MGLTEPFYTHARHSIFNPHGRRILVFGGDPVKDTRRFSCTRFKFVCAAENRFERSTAAFAAQTAKIPRAPRGEEKRQNRVAGWLKERTRVRRNCRLCFRAVHCSCSCPLFFILILTTWHACVAFLRLLLFRRHVSTLYCEFVCRPRFRSGFHREMLKHEAHGGAHSIYSTYLSF